MGGGAGTTSEAGGAWEVASRSSAALGSASLCEATRSLVAGAIGPCGSGAHPSRLRRITKRTAVERMGW